MNRKMTRMEFYATRQRYRAMVSSLIWYRDHNDGVKNKSIATMASVVHGLIQDSFDGWIVDTCYGSPQQRYTISIIEQRKKGASNQYLRATMRINSSGGF